MKKLGLILILFFAVGILTEPVSKACTFRGKSLSGKVKIVEHGEDFKVRAVEYGEDLKIIPVSYSQTDCGKWQFVEYGESFKIRFVENGEDFKIKYVEYGPGLP